MAYLQNHDQLGNRARGDRISQLVHPDRSKIGAALVLLSPFVPLLFQGEEWGATSPFQYFADYSQEPELAKSIREGRRGEFAAFGWKAEDVPDPLSLDTFASSKLNWSEPQMKDHADMVSWYRELIRLRRRYSGLTDGRLDVIRTYFDEGAQWLVVERGPTAVACNFADQARSIRVERTPLGELVLSSKPPISVDENRVELPAESVAIFVVTDRILSTAANGPMYDIAAEPFQR